MTTNLSQLRTHKKNHMDAVVIKKEKDLKKQALPVVVIEDEAVNSISQEAVSQELFK